MELAVDKIMGNIKKSGVRVTEYLGLSVFFKQELSLSLVMTCFIFSRIRKESKGPPLLAQKC